MSGFLWFSVYNNSSTYCMSCSRQRIAPKRAVSCGVYPEYHFGVQI